VLFGLAIGTGCGKAENYTRLPLDRAAVSTGGVVGPPDPSGSGGTAAPSTGGSGGGLVAGSGGQVAAPGGQVAAMGGETAVGGAVGSGGTTASGGSAATGGAPATGGVVGAGGGSGGGMIGSDAGGGVGTGGTPVASGGTTATGGTPGTGGVTATGGTPAAGGASAPGAGGSAGTVVFDCAESTTPSGGLVSDFSSWNVANGRWTSSSGVTGTVFSYQGDTASMATTAVDTTANDLHMTATVSAMSYAGGGIIMDSCQSAGTDTEIDFTVSGTSTCSVELQLQTFGQKPTTDTPAGGCTASCGNTYPRATKLSVTSSPVKVVLANMTNWTAAMATQIVGVQWQFTNPTTGSTSCTVDLHVDNVTFKP